LMENSEMQRIVMPLAATLIGAAFVAASPLPASASAEDHVKARHAKRIQVRCQKKIQHVVKKTQRVVELKSKGTKLRVERKAKRVVKRTQQVVEKAHKHGLVQAAGPPRATRYRRG